MTNDEMKTVILAPDADLVHESAEEWYDTYGWHISTEHAGDVCLQAVTFDTAGEPPAVIVTGILGENPDMLEHEAESLAERAVHIREEAEGITGLLDDAVHAYLAGDKAEVVSLLADARSAESEHGDAPATNVLSENLLLSD